MEFEDRLRAEFQAADSSIPPTRLSYVSAVGRGKRLRTVRFASIAGGVAVALAGAVFLGNGLPATDPGPVQPVGPDPVPTVIEADLDNPLKPPPDVAEGDCSAAEDAGLVSAQRDLPYAVEQLRRDMILAAWRCDFAGLEELIAADGSFNYDDGGTSSESLTIPLRVYWRHLEADGDPVTKVLVRLLNASPAAVEDPTGTVYVWPAAAAVESPSDEQWSEVERAFKGIYTPESIDKLRRFGFDDSNRIEITAEGEWTVFSPGLRPPPGESPREVGPTFEPGETTGRCSGSQDAHTGYEQPGLPQEVNEVRRAIIMTTWSCDYAGLEAIALSDDDPVFQYQADPTPAEPAEFWREPEQSGEPIGAVTRILARTLETTPARVQLDGGIGLAYVWPAAAVAADPSDADWADLEKVYEKSMVDEMRKNDRFYGYRVVITDEGDWMAFVLDV